MSKLVLLFVLLNGCFITVIGEANYCLKDDTNCNEKGEEIDDDEMILTNCDTAEPGKMAQCYGERFSMGMITAIELNDGLFKAMRRAQKRPLGTYYSIGYETGNEPGLVVAEQDIYNFKRSVKLPLSLGVYKDRTFLLSPNAEKRPVLLYLYNEVHTVPELLTDEMLKVTGGPGQHVLYMHPEASKMGEPKQDCTRVGSDKYIRALENREYTTLVVPGDLWCPQTLTSNHDIVYGSMEKTTIAIGGVSQATYRMKWAVIRNREGLQLFGKIPDGIKLPVF
uniref:Capsid protein n=1 Tax=Cryptocercus pudacuoensis jingmenvirus TaxID=3133548 RepID=A0AAT9JF19_9FLAV